MTSHTKARACVYSRSRHRTAISAGMTKSKYKYIGFYYFSN